MSFWLNSTWSYLNIFMKRQAVTATTKFNEIETKFIYTG
jgi:hypothetical protein